MKKVLHSLFYSALLLLTLESATRAQGSLSATVTPTAGTTVNLTTEGVTDWSHWGINNLVQDHKAVAGSPVGLISDETITGATGNGAYGDNQVAYSWTDGTPTVTATNSTTGIYQAGGQFQFTVPAKTTSQTLKVYIGGVTAGAQFTASLSDASAPDYNDGSLNPTNAAFAPDGNHFYGVYAVTFKAASAGQTLTITYAQTSGSGNITLQAATLFPTPTTAPAAPTNLVATAGTNRVGLTWNASASVGVSGYNVKRNTAATGTFTTIGTVTSTNYQDFTAVNGTTYFYEVTALNIVGEGPASNVASATPQIGIDGTGLTGNYYILNGASNAGNQNFNYGMTPTNTELDPTINFTGGGNAAGNNPSPWPDFVNALPNNFNVQWVGAISVPVTGSYVFATDSDDGSGVYLDGTLIVNNFFFQGPTVRSSSAITLTAGVKHTIRVQFFQGGGGYTMQLLWTPSGQAQQIVPSYVLFPNASLYAPPAVTLTGAPGAQSAILTWNQPDNAVSYNILRSLTAGGPYTTIKTGATGGTYTDTGLTNGTTYYYVVQAVNAIGTSPNSNEFAIAPTPPIIGNGVGLAGTYYAGDATDFSPEQTTPILFNLAPTVNYNVGNGGVLYNPVQFPFGTPANDFTAVWSGQLLAPFTGAYTFQTVSDDGSQLSLDTGSGYVIIVNNNNYQGPTAVTSAPITLTAGQKYNIKMEYYQGTGGATAQLLYNPLGSGLVIIPQTQLFPNFTAAPVAPTNLTALGADGMVILSWTGSQGAITYNVLRATKAGGPYTAVATGLTNTAYTDTTVTNGTTYYYVVVAVNNIGTSGNSNEASATPALPALTLHYTFENGPSGTDPDPVTDVSGSGNDGRIVGGDAGFTHDAPQGVWAGLTASTTEYVALPDAFDFGNQFTFFAFVKLTTDASGIQTILATNGSGGSTGGFSFYVNDYNNQSHALVFETNTGTASAGGNVQTKTRTAGGVYQYDGQYHAVAAVVNRTAGTVTMYYDGVLQPVDTAVIDTNFPTASGANRLGVFPSGDELAANSQFDEVRVYNGLLNAADIAAISASGATVTGVIALEGVPNLAGISPAAPLGTFHIGFRAPGAATETFGKDVTLTTAAGSPNGSFTATGVPDGTYDVTIEGAKNLRVLLPNVTISGATGTLANVTLPAGDANGDNSVDTSDFSLLVGSYGGDSSVPGSGYDPAEDFNFDGVVDTSDFSLLVGEYGNVGAP